ncbi:hypothetical protein MAM1_0180d07364 [Mucor ambiguus]|uniref:Uncharacterized protein n=1 Tax=Mucor ambiguus TaxID=91626 RepID=A0A0C9LW40_9FUNG|nr:hypothetical protein MAM1_0180d07364 [Mucor ambiguus]
MEQDQQHQSEQRIVQLEERREQLEPNAVCQICGRNGFKGAKGVQVHQSKSATCREMRLQINARAIIFAAAQVTVENGTAGHAQERQLGEEQINQEQEEFVQPIILIDKVWAGVKELVWATFKFIQWGLKIFYSLMTMFFGFSNVYFLYLYLTEKAPIINKTTFLLSPNFEEEFRVM